MNKMTEKDWRDGAQSSIGMAFGALGVGLFGHPFIQVGVYVVLGVYAMHRAVLLNVQSHENDSKEGR